MSTKALQPTLSVGYSDLVADMKQTPIKYWAKKFAEVICIPTNTPHYRTLCGSSEALLGNNYAVEKVRMGTPLCPKCALLKTTEVAPRILKMVEAWNTEGVAFSHVANMSDDGDFFTLIAVDSGAVGITSQTGLDIVYYDTEMYANDTDALRRRKKEVQNA